MVMRHSRSSLPAFAFLLALLLSHVQTASAFVAATGGNATNDIGGYRIHIFTNNLAAATNFAVTTAGDIEVLVVAGGGGGGEDVGGGGGAGGLIYSNAYPVIVSNYAVQVGGGGPGSGGGGTAGTNSIFGPLTARGGGGGGNWIGSAGSGANGGSGGGGAGYSAPQGNPGLASPTGQGSDGGAKADCGGGTTGSGGGGAGSVGQTMQDNLYGYVWGGTGLWYSISGSNVLYAMGGKGSGDHWGGQAAAAINTGNGGDGAGSGSPGKGGSGIVIVRYEPREPEVRPNIMTEVQ